MCIHIFIHGNVQRTLYVQCTSYLYTYKHILINIHTYNVCMYNIHTYIYQQTYI